MADRLICVGKQCTKTKKGNNFYNYYFTRPFTLYESEHSDLCLGMALQTEGSFTDFAVKPDDVVELVYTKGYQDKAILSDIVVVNPKIK